MVSNHPERKLLSLLPKTHTTIMSMLMLLLLLLLLMLMMMMMSLLARSHHLYLPRIPVARCCAIVFLSILFFLLLLLAKYIPSTPLALTIRKICCFSIRRVELKRCVRKSIDSFIIINRDEITGSFERDFSRLSKYRRDFHFLRVSHSKPRVSADRTVSLHSSATRQRVTV